MNLDPQILWEGRALRLIPQALVIQRSWGRGTLWIPLERIVAVTVRQNRLDRWLGIGSLHLVFRGGRSMTLRAIPDPFEAWKRLKIARFQLERSP